MTETKTRKKRGLVHKVLFGLGLLGASGVLVVLLGYLLWFVPAVNEKPVLERDYLNEWQGAEIAGNESGHAWPVMVRAVQELGAGPQIEHGFGGRNPMKPLEKDLRPGDEHWEMLEGYLSSMETNLALDRLREVADRAALGYSHSDDRDGALLDAQVMIDPGFDGWEPNPSEKPSMQALRVPYLGVAQRQARVLTSRAFVRGFAGPVGLETVLDVEATLAIGGHLERQRGGLATRVGIEIAGKAAEAVLEALARDGVAIEPATLDALDASLAGWQARERVNPFEYAVLSGRDLLQRVYNEAGDMTAFGVVALSEDELEMFSETSMLSRVEEGLSGQPFWIKAFGVFARGGYPDGTELEALIEEFVPMGEAFGRLDPWEVDPSQEPMKGIYRVARLFEALEGMPTQLGYAHSIASKMTDAGCVAVSRVSAVRLTIAAIRHRQETGDWPSSAAELGDGSAWPDGFTGEPLRMIMNDAGPMIYSAGTDRNDDGGRACEKPVQYWWPNQAAKMEKSRPEEYDGDWVLWTANLHEVRTAEREAVGEED